jgi:hypothetical protein
VTETLCARETESGNYWIVTWTAVTALTAVTIGRTIDDLTVRNAIALWTSGNVIVLRVAPIAVQQAVQPHLPILLRHRAQHLLHQIACLTLTQRTTTASRQSR